MAKPKLKFVKDHVYDPTGFRYAKSGGKVPNVCKAIKNGWFGPDIPPPILVKSRIAEFDGKAFRAWKKVWYFEKSGRCRHAIAELEISARAIRFQPDNKKCRASSARVIAFYDHNVLRVGGVLGKKLRRKTTQAGHRTYHMKTGESLPAFIYTVGETVKPKGARFSKNCRDICAPGIHFFLTIKEAQDYYL